MSLEHRGCRFFYNLTALTASELFIAFDSQLAMKKFVSDWKHVNIPHYLLSEHQPMVAKASDNR
ncbi:MAG: hypothetical protein L0J73_11355 [Halomonas sp.]|uniref:hypothetical protein n=1 Tax=unclassified Halomonas TaxID=2609666 RepID=UPI00264BB5CE|nr:hypothetical protein [Halomonas sp.]